MPSSVIRIKGARQHNLANLDVEIPRDKLVVVTGLSGSGKSSLAFNTIFAEGQRKYVESLSAYARQFLDQLQKPDVDYIEGLSPAVAIEQRSAGANPRSTIATITEIYDYLRLLYAAVGRPHDPATGERVERQTAQQIVDTIQSWPEGARAILLAPLVAGRKGEFRDVIEKVRREGFVRIRVDGEIHDLEGGEKLRLDKSKPHDIEAVVDRLAVRGGMRARLADSVETCLKWGGGRLTALCGEPGDADGTWTEHRFSTDYSNPRTGFRLPAITPRHFSFNSHLGACPDCHGIGTQLVCDPELMVPDPSLSLAEGALKPWSRGTKRMQAYYRSMLDALVKAYKAPSDIPYADLPVEFRVALMQGTGSRDIRFPGRGNTSILKPFEGLVPQMERLYRETESEFTRKRIRAYMNRQPCETCRGKRLRPEILAITLAAKGCKREIGIHDFCALPIGEARRFIARIKLDDQERRIVDEVLGEIDRRLGFMLDVGLGYLALDRESATLSGGEAQRIRLATQIGSGLAGVLYVLDEPSIGLHQRDNDRLIATLKRLRDAGNSVIVVEHDEDTIRAADHILDLGPGAGPRGGEIVAQGTIDDILAEPRSLTGQYLGGASRIPVPKYRTRPLTVPPNPVEGLAARVDSGWIGILGANAHNLRNIDVAIPIGCMTCVTGVSGSGKSTLVDGVLRRVLARRLHGAKERPEAHREVTGIEQVDKVIVIDQSPIGRTPRSNPATYTAAFGPIRELFAQLPVSRVRGYDSGRFSFNVKGGRCETCRGDGLIKVEMHFLPDVYVECDACGGTRYNRETLEATYKGRNIADVLDMNIDAAASFFRNVPAVSDKLNALQDVGLGYLRLGQSATTLSGGESQRVKLATELARKSTGRTVYLFDEPTTGLHVADIHRLLEVLMKLRDAGNTLVVIEHNLDVVKSADWVVDLGPEGGGEGGRVVATGPPESIAACKNSHTGQYLRRML